MGSIGIAIDVFDPPAMVDYVKAADSAGIRQLWLGQTSETPNALTVVAAALAATARVRIGTAIVPIYPIHPLALAQQAATVDALAPGRFQLGIGTSTRSRIAHQFGIDMDGPLDTLVEYAEIVRDVLWTGTVEHAGRHFTARCTFPQARPVPILLSALGRKAFRAAGRIADGALSWNCPLEYLRAVALPELQAGAEGAGRPVPPLYAHLYVALTTDRQAAFAAAREQLRFYTQAPFYRAMFAAAGCPVPDDGDVPEELVRRLVIYGEEAAVRERLLDLAGSDLPDLVISHLTGDDKASADRRLFELVAGLP